eukprot:6208908-Pleurochrysis_carterae.AAC.2
MFQGLKFVSRVPEFNGFTEMSQLPLNCLQAKFVSIDIVLRQSGGKLESFRQVERERIITNKPLKAEGHDCPHCSGSGCPYRGPLYSMAPTILSFREGRTR